MRKRGFVIAVAVAALLYATTPMHADDWCSDKFLSGAGEAKNRFDQCQADVINRSNASWYYSIVWSGWDRDACIANYYMDVAEVVGDAGGCVSVGQVLGYFKD